MIRISGSSVINSSAINEPDMEVIQDHPIPLILAFDRKMLKPALIANFHDP